MKFKNACKLILIIIIFLSHRGFSENNDNPKILVLHSYHANYIWTESLNKGILETLKSAGNYEIFVEYMDLIRNPSGESLLALEELFRVRYSDKKVKFDAVIVSDDPAFNFILEKRDKLFPHIPLVFCGINNFTRERISGHKNITGINESISVKETAEIALKMREKASKMGIVSGSNITMRQNLALFRKYAPRFEGEVEIVYLSALEPDILAEKLKQFGKEDVILYLGYLKTEEGREFTVQESLELIKKSTDAAIFGCWDFLIPNGAVGGKVVHGYSQGEMAAEAALKIINGETAGTIPVKMDSPNRYVFDDELLHRYNISQKLIPVNSIILNQSESTVIKDWEEIREKGFFSYSLFENHGSIMMVIDLDTGIIVDANRAAHDFYGYSHLINKNVSELNIIPREDLREVLMKSARLKQNHYNTRHLLADNSIKDIDVYSYPVEINNRVFLFGVINDITEKLKSEKALKNRTKMIIVSIITGLIMLSFFTIFLLKNNAERKKSEEKVKTLLSEKELLLREVHHRIKNNMNTIKGLLTLQILSQENSAAAESLKSAESRVHSMIMLYDRLYCTDNYRELPVREYLEPLAEEIVGSFPCSVSIKLETSIDDFILNVKILSPLGIIVNELLTNIMKYAFKGMDSGRIVLSAVLENRRVKVEISDNGIGIPDSVDFGRSTGFGLDLVKMLTDQIGASINIDRSSGTRSVIEFDI